jgi:hypothetical protein
MPIPKAAGGFTPAPAGVGYFKYVSCEESTQPNSFRKSAADPETRDVYIHTFIDVNRKDGNGKPYDFRVFTGTTFNFSGKKSGLTLFLEQVLSDIVPDDQTVESFVEQAVAEERDFIEDDLIGQIFKVKIKHVTKDGNVRGIPESYKLSSQKEANAAKKNQTADDEDTFENE